MRARKSRINLTVKDKEIDSFIIVHNFEPKHLGEVLQEYFNFRKILLSTQDICKKDFLDYLAQNHPTKTVYELTDLFNNDKKRKLR